MKKKTTILFAIATIFSFTQCSNSSSEKLCSNADTRGKIISELMSNDAYMNQVMDSMQTKHADAMLTHVLVIAQNDNPMQATMMNNMMDMCKDDTAMCKMMMGKTMDMCDMDKSKCSMMMGTMQEHPKGMQSMKDMGMCDMKGGMDMSHKK